ncbi:MAG: TRAP transporter small permease [Alphaproteobacteria bacterium]
MQTETPDRLIAVVDHVVRLIAYGGGVVLLALMLLTVSDVGLRYFFNAPIFGAQDLSVLFLLIVASLAIPYGGRAGSHVAVDLLGFVAGPKITRWTDLAVRMAGAAMLAVVAWRSTLDGLNAALYGQTSDLLQWPFLPYYMINAFGMMLYSLVLLAEFWLMARGKTLTRLGA